MTDGVNIRIHAISGDVIFSFDRPIDVLRFSAQEAQAFGNNIVAAGKLAESQKAPQGTKQ